nr:fimbrillin family protein [uncultured Bacteroides sp.]
MKTIFTLLIPASLLLAGCTADETPGMVDPAIPPVEATVPLTVESAAVNAEVTTRAAVTSGSIGIFLTGTGYTAINNRQYDYGTPAWTPNGGVANTIYLGGTTASVCAYHPWQASLNNSAAIPLTSQLFDNASKDISFATARNVDGSSANKSTSFAMTRAYAKVTFVFQRSNYPGTCQVQKVELKNLLPSAMLNIGTGAYSTAAGMANSSVSQTKNVTVPATGTVAWGSDFLLVPCTPASTGMTLVITVDGKTMTTTIPTASYKPTKGEYKTITITVQGTGINTTSVTTTDWANGNLGPFVPVP